MRFRVPLRYEPSPAAARMMPIFLHHSLWIFTEINIVEPVIHGRGIVAAGSFWACIAEIAELF